MCTLSRKPRSKVAMRNDLIAYLREEATKAIEHGVNEATESLNHAQNDVRNAQRSVDSLMREIDNMRRTVKRERDRDIQNLRNAENTVANERRKVNNLQRDIDRTRNTIRSERSRDAAKVQGAERAVSGAQNKVNSLQRQIDNTRSTIRRERSRDTQKLRNARRDVTNAQRKVDGLRGEIRSTKSRINVLRGDIRRKKRWLDNSPWFRKADRGIDYAAYAAAKNAEIGILYGKIGGIETAILAAKGVLEVAKQAVRGIERAANTFPIDADPRIIGLFAAKETAKEGATAGLKVAEGALEVAKATVGGLGDAATFIVEVGLGGLFDVKSASFEGQLNAVKGGFVQLSLNVELMGQPQHLNLGFNFHDPLSGAKALGDEMLKALK